MTPEERTEKIERLREAVLLLETPLPSPKPYRSATHYQREELDTRDKAKYEIVKGAPALLAGYDSMVRLVKSITDDFECLSECDDHGHSEYCPLTYEFQAVLLLKKRLDEAQAAIREYGLGHHHECPKFQAVYAEEPQAWYRVRSALPSACLEWLGEALECTCGADEKMEALR